MTGPDAATALRSAFERFVALVSPIESVRYVGAYHPQRPDVFTYIECMDDRVMQQVLAAEAEIDDQFPELMIDFHIVFLDGRTIDDFVRPVPDLFYARSEHSPKERQRGASK